MASTSKKPPVDWEAVEREYRAGQLSVREIARRFGCSDTAVRKRADAENWTRALASEVRKAVKEALVREDGSHGSSQGQRASDREIVESAAERGFAVVTSHRRDIQQLHGLKRVIAERLSIYLQGGNPDGPFMGDKESPGDLLEKLSRVTSRLIPLERQAHNLDEQGDDSGGNSAPVSSAAERILRLVADEEQA